MKKKQVENAFVVLDELRKSSITSYYVIISILCVLMKERGFKTGRENSYEKTSNERIKKIFGSKKLGPYAKDDNALDVLKASPKQFFNWVYRDVAGNRGYESGDGWRTRGGGFNQVTGLLNYKRMQRLTGYALVAKPGMIIYPECAAKCVVAFFEDEIRRNKEKLGPDYIWANNENALMNIVRINAGFSKSKDSTVISYAYKNSSKHWKEMAELYRSWKSLRGLS